MLEDLIKRVLDGDERPKTGKYKNQFAYLSLPDAIDKLKQLKKDYDDLASKGDKEAEAKAKRIADVLK